MFHQIGPDYPALRCSAFSGVSEMNLVLSERKLQLTSTRGAPGSQGRPLTRTAPAAEHVMFAQLTLAPVRMHRAPAALARVVHSRWYGRTCTAPRPRSLYATAAALLREHLTATDASGSQHHPGSRFRGEHDMPRLYRSRPHRRGTTRAAAAAAAAVRLVQWCMLSSHACAGPQPGGHRYRLTGTLAVAVPDLGTSAR